jgi:hypothetical protein
MPDPSSLEPNGDLSWFDPTLAQPTQHRATCFRCQRAALEGWAAAFPTGAAIARKFVDMNPGRGLIPDQRFLRCLKCEYEIFRSVEHATELPASGVGFAAVDEFMKQALIILQRPKSRAGRSQ